MAARTAGLVVLEGLHIPNNIVPPSPLPWHEGYAPSVNPSPPIFRGERWDLGEFEVHRVWLLSSVPCCEEGVVILKISDTLKPFTPRC